MIPFPLQDESVISFHGNTLPSWIMCLFIVPLTVREHRVNKHFTLGYKHPVPVVWFNKLLYDCAYGIMYEICVCARVCLPQRNDDEAVVDRGGTRSQQRTNFEQEDLEGTLTDTECI